MPRKIFPSGQPLIRFDTRVLKSTHDILVEITKCKRISLNQAVNEAIFKYIEENKAGENDV